MQVTVYDVKSEFLCKSRIVLFVGCKRMIYTNTDFTGKVHIAVSCECNDICGGWVI